MDLRTLPNLNKCTTSCILKKFGGNSFLKHDPPSSTNDYRSFKNFFIFFSKTRPGVLIQWKMLFKNFWKKLCEN